MDFPPRIQKIRQYQHCFGSAFILTYPSEAFRKLYAHIVVLFEFLRAELVFKLNYFKP